MRRILPLALAGMVLTSISGAAQAQAGLRLLSYDAADRVTRALTQGVTLEVRTGWFGATEVRRILPTTARGSAPVERGGPAEVLGALPPEAERGAIYAIPFQQDGRALTRALCPAADEAWLVVGRVRAGRPLVLNAVGRWADGRLRHCVRLSYVYRGEWAAPPSPPGGEGAEPPPPAPRR